MRSKRTQEGECEVAADALARRYMPLLCLRAVGWESVPAEPGRFTDISCTINPWRRITVVSPDRPHSEGESQLREAVVRYAIHALARRWMQHCGMILLPTVKLAI